MHVMPHAPGEASQPPPEIAEAFADGMNAGMKEADANERVWHGCALIWQIATLSFLFAGWQGSAGLCIWVAVVVSMARLVRTLPP
jgi:hypothetical protein